MTGTVIDVTAVLLAGLLVWLRVPEIPARIQQRLQFLLGALVLGLGFHVIWRACSSPGTGFLRLAAIGGFSLILGKFTGRRLGLQHRLNRLGRFAGRVLEARNEPDPAGSRGAVFRASTVVFCVTPIAVLGALQSAWGGDERLFLLKAAVDALATLSLVRTAGGAVVLGTVPILAVQGSLVLAAMLVRPGMTGAGADAAGYAASGFVLLPVALVMLQVVRIPLADYLPAVLWAPVLAWLTG